MNTAKKTGAAPDSTPRANGQPAERADAHETAAADQDKPPASKKRSPDRAGRCGTSPMAMRVRMVAPGPSIAEQVSPQSHTPRDSGAGPSGGRGAPPAGGSVVWAASPLATRSLALATKSPAPRTAADLTAEMDDILAFFGRRDESAPGPQGRGAATTPRRGSPVRRRHVSDDDGDEFGDDDWLNAASPGALSRVVDLAAAQFARQACPSSPVGPSVFPPVDQSVSQPVAKPVAQPAAKLAAEPAAKPTDTPADKPADKPVGQNVAKPAKTPTKPNNPPRNDAAAEFQLDDLEDEALEQLAQLADLTMQPWVDEEKVRAHRYYRIVVLRVDPHPTQKTFCVGFHGHCEPLGVDCHVTLADQWMETELDVGDIVNVVAQPQLDNAQRVLRFRVSAESAHDVIVVHPDLLFTGTALSESILCTRKAVLEARCRGAELPTDAIVYGNLIHELIQTCLAQRQWGSEYMHGTIEGLIAAHVHDLWACGQTETQARELLAAQVDGLQLWAKRYLADSPQPDGVLREHGSLARAELRASLTRLLAVEEPIWSPMYGLKGMVDATVQACVSSRTSVEHVLAPLEIKTGKQTSVASHRAQTALYTLLLGDVYGVTVRHGFLFYQKTGEMVHVPVRTPELHALIVARNRLARSVHRRSALSDMLQRPQTCSRCFARETCMIFHAAVENGTAETAGVGALFGEIAGALTPAHREFLRRWDRALALEEQQLHRTKRDIWLLTAAEREAAGACLGDMVVVQGASQALADPFSSANAGSGRLRAHLVTFERRAAPSQERNGAAAVDTGVVAHALAKGDPVVISRDSSSRRCAMAIGFVVRHDSGRVVVRVDHELSEGPVRAAGFDADKRQCFLNGLSLGASRDGRASDGPSGKDERPTYRIDRDELGTEMQKIRNNLVDLFRPGRPPRLRELVVDLAAPRFSAPDATPMATATGLNDDQRHALERVLAAQDYALILGMPGTGKTTTIAALIRALVAAGNSVLLTSFTHAAVDNVLLKLLDAKIPLVRLGRPEKMHPEIAPHAAATQTAWLETVAALDAFYAERRVVATTALGMRHAALLKRRFDYCIVDEASQLTLPVCLGPLAFADRFVLVGDHYQLPPLVRNPGAVRDGLLGQSLFKRLCVAHPDAIVSLTHQYRMHADIMALANVLVYGGRLRCGTQAVASRRLKLASPLPAAMPAWAAAALDPARAVAWLDTDASGASEARAGDAVTNPPEVRLVHALVTALVHLGVPQTQIGVVTPYRAQLHALAPIAAVHPHVELSTVDRYQGRDKEVILVSLVRSNAQRHVGPLLRDWRRLNVALTRAKSKLLLCGSLGTLGGSALFADLITLVRDRGWVLPVPASLDLDVSAWMPVREPAPSALLALTAARSGPAASDNDSENMPPLELLSGSPSLTKAPFLSKAPSLSKTGKQRLSAVYARVGPTVGALVSSALDPGATGE